MRQRIIFCSLIQLKFMKNLNFWTLNIEIPGFFHSKNDLKIDFFFQVEKWGKIIFCPKFNWNSWNIWIFGPKILQLQNFHFDFWHKNSNISLILLPWIAYFWRENSKIWTVRIFNKIEFYDKNWDTTAVCKVELYFLCASMGLSISQ